MRVSFRQRLRKYAYCFALQIERFAVLSGGIQAGNEIVHRDPNVWVAGGHVLSPEL
jgi:hypothetical protein